MIEQLSYAVLLASGLICIVFAFIEYVIHKTNDCKHDCCTTFDSYHEKMCIDCGEKFSTKETKK